MPITGKFVADFDDFNRAVQQAEVELRSFETGASSVEKSLTRMVDSFSGRKVISDATLMVEAIDRIGGASKLTQDELEKAGNKAAEAAAKMRALGMAVPESMDKLAASATETESAFARLTTEIGASAAGYFTAEAALEGLKKAFDLVIEAAKAFGELVLEGAHEAEVAQAFDRMTESVGQLGDALLGKLRDATHNTVSDFDLMKASNALLTAGVKLTGDQFTTLAAGAFALAHQKGIAVAEALDAVTESMVKGSAKGVAYLTGKVDLEKAEDKYAKTLGGVREQLQSGQKILADRLGVLDAVAQGTARVGEVTEGLADKVAQAQTAWQNFRGELGESISSSSVLIAGIDAVGKAFTDAFGTDHKALIAAITAVVENMAIATIDLGKTTVDVGASMINEWNDVREVLLRTVQGLDILGVGFEKVTLAATKAWAAMTPGTSGEADIKRIQKNIDDMTAQFVESGKAFDDLVAARASVTEGANQMQSALDGIRAKMVAAQEASHGLADAQNEGAAAHRAAASAATAYGDAENEALKPTREEVAEKKKLKEALADLATVGINWRDTLANMNGTIVEAAQWYLRAGANVQSLAEVYKLSATQVKALQASIKDEVEQQKKADQAILETTKLWDEYNTLRVAQGGTATDVQIAQVKRWADDLAAKMQKAGADTKEFYDALEATAKAKTDAILVDWQALGAASRTALEQAATKAENTYQVALGNLDQYSTETIAKFGEQAKAARAAADAWGTGMEQNADKSKKAIDMVTDSVKKQALTWSEAMDAVTKGQGTMSTQVPAGQIDWNVYTASLRDALMHIQRIEWTKQPVSEPLRPAGPASSDVTINMNGLLLTNDPTAREQLRVAVSDALQNGINRSRKLSF
jgi:hypothetical protein